MNRHNQSAPESALAAAMRLAQIKATDNEEMENCIADMQKHAFLDEGSAREVAAAFRAKNLPNIAAQYGIPQHVIAQLMEKDSLDAPKSMPKRPMNDDSFADDTDPEMGEAHNESPEDEIREHDGHMPTSDEEEAEGESLEDHPQDTQQAIEDHGGEEMDPAAMPMKKKEPLMAPQDDLGEEDELGDGPMATVQIKIPANKLELVQQALEQALGEGSFDDDAAPAAPGSDMGSDDQAMMDDEDEDEDSDEFDSHSAPTAPKSFPNPASRKPSPMMGEDDDEMGVAPSHDTEESLEAPRPQQAIARRKVNTMSRQAMSDKELAARKAERRSLLNGVRTASDEGDTKPKNRNLGSDTSHNGKPFQFAGEAQYTGEDSYPTMTLEGSEGNSLKDNPQFGKQMIPTKNPENLMLKDSYEVGTKDDDGGSDLEWTVDFEKLDNIPSGNPDRGNTFKVPTQIPENNKRKRTIAKRTVECQGCNNPENYNVVVADCTDCNNRVAICEQCESEAFCPSCAAGRYANTDVTVADDEAEYEGVDPKEKAIMPKKRASYEGGKDEEKGDGPRLNIQPNGDGFTRKPKKGPKEEGDFLGDPGRSEGEPGVSETKKAMELFMARVKTAYRCVTRQALAELIDVNEVDDIVETWLSEGLTPKAMTVQTNLALRHAQAMNEKVIAAQAEFSAPRTASRGYAGNPSFTNGGSSNYRTASVHDNPAPRDLANALAGGFTVAHGMNSGMFERNLRAMQAEQVRYDDEELI